MTPHDAETAGLPDRSPGLPLIGGGAPAPAPLDGPRRPPALATAAPLPALLKSLRRCWPTALLAGLACAFAAAAAAFALVPSKYTARAMLHVAAAEPSLLAGSDRQVVQSGPIEYRTYLKTQQTLLRSHTVLTKALGDAKVRGLRLVREAVRTQDDPASWLAGRLTLEDEGEILFIGLGGDDPAELAAVVNAVAEAYLAEIVNREHLRRQRRYEMLRDVAEQFKKTLYDRREQLKRLAVAVGSNKPDTLTYKHQLALAAQADLEKELQQVESEMRRVSAELEVLGDRPDDAAAAVEEALTRDETAQELRSKIGVQEAKLAELLRSARSKGDPAIIKVRADLAQKRRALAEYEAKLRPALAARLRQEALRAGGPGGPEPSAQLQVLAERREKTAAAVAVQAEANRSLFEKSAELEEIQDGIAATAAAAKQVNDDLARLEVELKAPARVQMIEPATAPKARDAKRQLLATAAAGFSALGLSLLGVAWWYARSARIDTVDEVMHGLGLRIVGALPPLPARRQLAGPRRVDDAWRGQLTEAVNATRAMLLRLSRDEPLRVVLVTSAVGGEGKTTLSSHLAISLARAGRRTVLVDGDLRSPAAHRVFELPSAPGLAEALRGEVDPEDVARPTLVDGLWLVPAGVGDEAALQALGTEAVRGLFDRLRARYDFVVVDTAPALPVADTLLLSPHVDGVLLTILGDVSRAPRVYAAYERLAGLGARMLGAVVIGARGEQHRYASDYPYATAGR
jgi:capsular exopolysaccharide synthesis family protein